MTWIDGVICLGWTALMGLAGYGIGYSQGVKSTIPQRGANGRWIKKV